MRKNSKARGWVARRIENLRREGRKGKEAVAIALSEARKNGLLRNPSEQRELETELAEAGEVSEGFHGRKPKETVEVVEDHQYRSELAQLGELEELEVFSDSYWDENEDLLTLTFQRKGRSLVRLAGTPNRKQIVLVGGDQEIDDDTLESMNPGWDKDKVSLGYVYSISYWADKHHLQGSNRKNEAYMHCFGEQSFPNPDAREDGKADYEIWALEEKLAAGVLPELIYDRLNATLGFVGGVYTVEDEGITN